RFDAGVDAQVAVTTVAKGGAAFTVQVDLQQNASNQFFLVAVDGKLRSTAVTVPLITEDSIAPTVKAITRLGPSLTNAPSAQFQVEFSEPVTGVDASDFKAVGLGGVSSGAVSVSGSGKSYTVTVNDIFGEGTLGLNLIDDDTIRDLLTNPSQAHPLGGLGLVNGDFTTG